MRFSEIHRSFSGGSFGRFVVALVVTALGSAPAAETVGGPHFELARLKDSALARSVARLDAAGQAKVEQQLQRSPIPLADLDQVRAVASGALFYYCPLQEGQRSAPAEPALAAVSTAVTSQAPVAPVLHSRRGSRNVIIIDFTGHTVSGTAWNDPTSYTGEPVNYAQPSFPCLPFSLDGDRANFTPTEQEFIRQVWLRVAEDYAGFDVDVTTDEAGITLNARVARALVTAGRDSNGKSLPYAFGADGALGSAGVAFVDVFALAGYDRSGNTEAGPALVYYEANPLRADYTAEVVAHEIGHNLGLHHEGLASPPTGYYQGHGSGSTSWSPIMGAGYDKNVTQWSKGEYFNANNTEDQIAKITAYLQAAQLGIATSSGTAIPLTIQAGGSISAPAITGAATFSGDTQAYVLPYGGAQAFFSISVQPCRLSLAVAPLKLSDTSGGNLQANLRLLDASGAPIATKTGDGCQATVLTTTITSAGTYILEVSRGASGDPLATSPTGWTSYGSGGQFRISGAALPTVTTAITHTPNRIATSAASLVFTITFGEAVTGFTLSDVSLVNAASASLSGSGAVYTLTVAPLLEGLVTVSVPAGSAQAVSNGGGTAAGDDGVFYDATRPTPTISPDSGYTKRDPAVFTVTFSEVVTGFSAAGITVTTGSLVGVSGAGRTYEVTVAGASGSFGWSIPAGVANDEAGNPNLPAQAFARLDQTPPRLSLTPQTLGEVGFPSVITISASKPVTGLTRLDIKAPDATVTSIEDLGNSQWNLTIVPQATRVVLTILADAVVDLAGNGSPAETLPLTFSTPAKDDSSRCGLDKIGGIGLILGALLLISRRRR